MSSCRRSWHGGQRAALGPSRLPALKSARASRAPRRQTRNARMEGRLHSSSHRSASSDCVGDVAIVPIRAVPPEGALSRSPKLMRAFRGNVTGDASACAHRQSWERWRRGSTRRRGGCASSCMRAQGNRPGKGEESAAAATARSHTHNMPGVHAQRGSADHRARVTGHPCPVKVPRAR